MLFERIESPGLAQYSYLLGEGTQAIVIDPRRDCNIYLDLAQRAGMDIIAILETHRHEDFVSGSVELAARSGAPVWHADAQLPYRYGQPGHDGQTWQLGTFTLQALLTPGHTEGSLSYVLHEADGKPWMVFTGDVLFAGEVGRVDFLGMERAPEMAGLLYDSIFGKLLPLGDGVLVWPGHGYGSACGSSIAARTWTTLGLERTRNPRLQHTARTDFVAAVTRQLPKPAYFTRMEAWNLHGAPLLASLPHPRALAPTDFAAQLSAAQVVDTRSGFTFAASHVPGALAMELSRLPQMAGWFLTYDMPLLLIVEDDPRPALATLRRQGFDAIQGYLGGGMSAWINSGLDMQSVGVVSPHALAQTTPRPWLLDVRAPDEYASGALPDAHNIPLGLLPNRLGDIPADGPLILYCGSGPRSLLGASLLQRAGRHNIHILAGGVTAWQTAGFALQ